MGQKPSCLGGISKTKLPLSWIFLGARQTSENYPQQPSKSDVRNEPEGRGGDKSKRNQSVHSIKNENVDEARSKIVKNEQLRTDVVISGKRKCGRKKSFKGRKKSSQDGQFGYEISNVGEFLTKATMENPANIPVVLACPSILYQTKIGGYQMEISLPLGMVVNAIFKKQRWLYVQTPHAEEGYVNYEACLPLGIIPPPGDDEAAPCWEKSTDIFPKPSGNLTDTEKLSSKSECGREPRYRTRRKRNAASTCGEKSVDRLYLRAAASAKVKGKRQTLLVITKDYDGGGDKISVRKGDVVVLLGARANGWFWIRKKEGFEGYIPSDVAGHGFL